ncbi:MAG: hypothetical protein NVS4B2_23200 [Chloroflexota bacterium]
MHQGRKTAILAGAGLTLGLAVVPSAVANIPPGAVPITKDMCKDGGYASFFDPSGARSFRNQGSCVSASNHGAYYIFAPDQGIVHSPGDKLQA